MDSIKIQTFYGGRDYWANELAFYGDDEELLLGECGGFRRREFFCINWRNPPPRRQPNIISRDEFLYTPVPAGIDTASIVHAKCLKFPMHLPQLSDYVLVQQQNSTHGIGIVYRGDRIWDFFWDEKVRIGSYSPHCYGACLSQDGHILAISCSTDDGDQREEPEIHLFDMQKQLATHAPWRRRNYLIFLSMCGFDTATVVDHTAAPMTTMTGAASKQLVENNNPACLLVFNCTDLQLYIESFI